MAPPHQGLKITIFMYTVYLLLNAGGINMSIRSFIRRLHGTPRGPTPSRERKTPEDVDLDRIVWDPEYRKKVRERLNGDAPRKHRPSR